MLLCPDIAWFIITFSFMSTLALYFKRQNTLENPDLHIINSQGISPINLITVSSTLCYYMCHFSYPNPNQMHVKSVIHCTPQLEYSLKAPQFFFSIFVKGTFIFCLSSAQRFSPENLYPDLYPDSESPNKLLCWNLRRTFYVAPWQNICFFFIIRAQTE